MINCSEHQHSPQNGLLPDCVGLQTL